MPKFNITVARTAVRTKSFEIEAETEEQARAEALEMAPEDYFDANESTAEYEVDRVHRY